MHVLFKSYDFVSYWYDIRAAEDYADLGETVR